MKYFHQISLRAQELPASEFESLCQMAPDARVHYGLNYTVQKNDSEGDEFIRHALTLFKGHGLSRYTVAVPKHYGYTIMRQYEESDVVQSEILILLDAQTKLSSCKGWKMHREPIRDEQGRLLILASDAKPSLKFGSAHYPQSLFVVSDEVRQLLECGGLTGLHFGEVALKGKSAQVSPRPFWELCSTITLPKIANTDKLVHLGTEAEPFGGDYSRRVGLHDPPFSVGELHYRRSDLAAMGQFDIANMFEIYGFSRPLIVSQRFYQYCLKYKIMRAFSSRHWCVLPVRIDPD